MSDSILGSMNESSDRSPSNADLKKMLEKIHNRLVTVEEKLESLKSLEVKVQTITWV